MVDRRLGSISQRMRYCLGEFLGTFILVFFGCSSVAVSILFNAFSGLWQVAVVWGMAVTLAIYATRSLSCAHLNPAVTVGMVLAGRMEWSRLPWYVGSQLAGGVAAGTALLLIFGPALSGFESAAGIVRGSAQSVQTAMIFGEYFPNPGMKIHWLQVSKATAFGVEFFGTFILVTMIFLLTEGANVGRPSEGTSPLFIGATVAMLISVLAPLTQCGINPARDFGPRLVAFFAGWDSIAIPGPKGGFLLVYILGPILGGTVAAYCFTHVVEPLLAARMQSTPIGCVCGPEPCSCLRDTDSGSFPALNASERSTHVMRRNKL